MIFSFSYLFKNKCITFVTKSYEKFKHYLLPNYYTTFKNFTELEFTLDFGFFVPFLRYSDGTLFLRCYYIFRESLKNKSYIRAAQKNQPHNAKVKLRNLSYLQKIQVLFGHVKWIILVGIIMLYKCISL